MNRAIVIVACVFVFGGALTSGETRSARSQQQSVSREAWCNPELQRHTVALPTVVVESIMNTPAGKSATRTYREEGQVLKGSTLFESARVSVAESGDQLFLVGGSGLMTGGDNRWFWLVCQSGGKAEVLFHDGTGCVYVEPRATRGYRDIQTIWSSASTTIIREYNYDGYSYKLVNERVLKNH